MEGVGDSWRHMTPTWARIKASLEKMDRIGLMALIHDLYEVDALNRRELHERFAPNDATFRRYPSLVRAAVFPDPLSDRPIRLRDVPATICEYQRATGEEALEDVVRTASSFS
jgi:hypothetical protein